MGEKQEGLDPGEYLKKTHSPFCVKDRLRAKLQTEEQQQKRDQS